jgi:hypothetical protein
MSEKSRLEMWGLGKLHTEHTSDQGSRNTLAYSTHTDKGKVVHVLK